MSFGDTLTYSGKDKYQNDLTYSIEVITESLCRYTDFYIKLH